MEKQGPLIASSHLEINVRTIIWDTPLPYTINTNTSLTYYLTLIPDKSGHKKFSPKKYSSLTNQTQPTPARPHIDNLIDYSYMPLC